MTEKPKRKRSADDSVFSKDFAIFMVYSGFTLFLAQLVAGITNWSLERLSYAPLDVALPFSYFILPILLSLSGIITYQASKQLAPQKSYWILEALLRTAVIIGMIPYTRWLSNGLSYDFSQAVVGWIFSLIMIPLVQIALFQRETKREQAKQAQYSDAYDAERVQRLTEQTADAEVFSKDVEFLAERRKQTGQG